MVSLGIVPEPNVLKRFGTPMSSIMGEAFAVTSERWDSLVALMQSRSAPIRDATVATNGFLRLAVVDFALRIFALVRLADLDPPASTEPVWAGESSQSRLLRGFAKDAGLTREQPADLLERSGTPISDKSVDNWLDGRVRPTRKNVAILAEALAHDSTPANARRIEHHIQRQLTLAHLADLLAAVIGRKQVNGLSTAIYRYVRLIAANLAEMQRPPLEEKGETPER